MEQDWLIQVGRVVGVGQRHYLRGRDAGEQDLARPVAEVQVQFAVRDERRNLQEITTEDQK